MPDSPELLEARAKVAELERRDELTKKIAVLEQQLAGHREELANIGKPPKPEPAPEVGKRAP